ncbi:MAG: cell division protein FtsL [Myxococcota bacterium]
MRQRRFLILWCLAVSATVSAFVVHLALRGRTVDLGYRLGKARAEQARLREVKRVLELEAASHQTPQRVEMVARTLLGMSPPPPEKVIPIRLRKKQRELEKDPEEAIARQGGNP